MSLQDRTIVVKNFDPERTTNKLLKELCLQAGPVRNVVLRSDHAFVEYEDVESVGYAKALLDGVQLFDRHLSFEPKTRLLQHGHYEKALRRYISYDIERRAELQRQKEQEEMKKRFEMMQQQPYLQQPIYQQQQQQPFYQSQQPTSSPFYQQQQPIPLPFYQQHQPQPQIMPYNNLPASQQYLPQGPPNRYR